MWIAGTDYRGEISLSDEILKRVTDSYRRMRNTARFLLGNLDGFEPATDQVRVEELVDLDRWAIARAQSLQDELRVATSAYEFHRVYQLLHNFCVVDMGGFYLDVIKDRLYTTGRRSIPRRSAQTAMYQIAEAMVRWLAPVLSFTAEEIWEALPGERGASVFLETWHELMRVGDPEVDWAALMPMRDAVARALEARRAAGEIGAGLEAEVTLYTDSVQGDRLRELGDELRFVLITSAAIRRAAVGRAPGRGGRRWLADRRHAVRSAQVHPLLAPSPRRRQCRRNIRRSAGVAPATSMAPARRGALPDADRLIG